MRILVAEDDRASAKLFVRQLTQLGHDVLLARDGEEAWALLQANPVDIVLTDWQMPNMDGLSFVRKIREAGLERYIYVIMVSTRDSEEERARALEFGVDDFLVKPCKPTEIRMRLQPALRILEMHNEVIRTNNQLKKREQLLLEANSVAEWARNRFSQLFDGLPVAAFTFDSEGAVFEINGRAAKLFETQPHEAFGKKVWDFLGPDFVGEQEFAEVAGVFEGRSFEDAPWDDGKSHFLVSGYPLVGQNDEISGAIATVIDVTRQRNAEFRIQQQAHDLLELNETLKALAVTDVLTGVPNHRAFKEALGEYVEASGDEETFSMVMIDVDHFKLFNDTHGHQAGDEVLRLVGNCLSESVRDSDFVARYGGEEFCILFARHEEEHAIVMANRVRNAVARIESPYEQITVSMGVATFGPDHPDSESLIRDADTAMYAAKRTGRNRVVGASSCADTISGAKSNAA